MSVICITCTNSYLQTLVDEMNDWKDEGAQVFLSGVTDKANHGYLLLECDRPIPANFVKKLHTDEGIIDFFTIGLPPAA